MYENVDRRTDPDPIVPRAPRYAAGGGLNSGYERTNGRMEEHVSIRTSAPERYESPRHMLNLFAQKHNK